jgi:hypothetical protein
MSKFQAQALEMRFVDGFVGILVLRSIEVGLHEDDRKRTERGREE